MECGRSGPEYLIKKPLWIQAGLPFLMSLHGVHRPSAGQRQEPRSFYRPQRRQQRRDGPVNQLFFTQIGMFSR